MPPTRQLQFIENIARSRELVGLGQAIAGLTVGRVDAADMYRAALVQAVAALDSYVHGVVLDYAVDILLQRKDPGSKTQVGLHFGAVRELVGATSPTELELLARAHIADRLSRETFQKPDDIGIAFATVGIGKIWSTTFGNNAHSTKQGLSLIVNRRNRIVHSCDVNPLNSSEVMPLTDSDALTAAESVSEIVTAIDLTLDASESTT